METKVFGSLVVTWVKWESVQTEPTESVEETGPGRLESMQSWRETRTTGSQTARSCRLLLAAALVATLAAHGGARAAHDAGTFCVVVPNPLTAQLPFDHGHLHLNALSDVPLAHVVALAAER